MRRKKLPQPWFRPSRGLWYVTLDGKQHNLGPDETDAFTEYERLLRAPKRPTRQPEVSADTLVGLIDRFLDWCREHRSAGTFDWYQWRLQKFVDRIDKGLLVAKFRPFHLDEALKQFPTWSSGGKHNLARAVQRVFRWAYQKGYIDRSPLIGYEKPRAGKRDVVISEQEFQRIMGFARHSAFRDLLLATWETGCRPQESLLVEARHVDLANKRWVLSVEEAKGQQRPRIIYLNESALAITRRLMTQHPRGPLFRNSNGKPWTTDAVNCCFTALQIRMGKAELKRQGLAPTPEEQQAALAKLSLTIRSNGVVRNKTAQELACEARRKLTDQLAKRHAPKFCLYNLRHTWLDRAIKSGVDPLTCAILMGHRDTSTIARVYQHLSQSPDYLHGVACKATT